jgi:hypothetical protein
MKESPQILARLRRAVVAAELAAGPVADAPRMLPETVQLQTKIGRVSSL